ncbi:MAG: DUF763 domain-containing protein [Caldisericaceae bacterium]|nr:DUF763 domain-containing protein [Caldisericaceae bacterium]
MRSGYADLPLHGGKAPKWLFERMKKLAREISLVIIAEYGTNEFLRRISDPIWFQSFGCVLGFDWHSSGVTTTVTGALAEGLKAEQKNIGLFFAGGKGRRGLKTPEDIARWGERGVISLEKVRKFQQTSRLVAKVDADALQDGFRIYHHFFVFTKSGKWAVVQQGLKGESKRARRYHWISDNVKSFVSDPHKGIVSAKKETVLNLVDGKIPETRKKIAELSAEKPELVLKEIKHIEMPFHHPVFKTDFNEKRLRTILRKTHELSPSDFESLLLIRGVGEKTLRALSLVAHVAFGTPLSFKDPALFSFAHGGKDGYPFPVDRETYDRSIAILKDAVRKAKIGDYEKINALKRLSRF